jgi:hypothetical protein
MIDQSKLGPAPWTARQEEGNPPIEGRWTVDELGLEDGETGEGLLYEADAKFIALSRNAFDIWFKHDPEAAMMWLTDTDRWLKANVAASGGPYFEARWRFAGQWCKEGYRLFRHAKARCDEEIAAGADLAGVQHLSTDEAIYSVRAKTRAE